MFNSFSKKVNKDSIHRNIFKSGAYTQEQVSFIKEGQGVLFKKIHRTRNYDDALSILKNGLVVESSLYQCIDDVGISKEDINIANVFNFRFGRYSLIIGIPAKNPAKKDLDSYLIPAHKLSSPVIEEIIQEEDFEKPFLLPSKYISGIANQNTGEIIRNPKYNPFDKTDSSLDVLVKDYSNLSNFSNFSNLSNPSNSSDYIFRNDLS